MQQLEFCPNSWNYVLEMGNLVSSVCGFNAPWCGKKQPLPIVASEKVRLMQTRFYLYRILFKWRNPSAALCDRVSVPDSSPLFSDVIASVVTLGSSPSPLRMMEWGDPESTMWRCLLLKIRNAF